MNEDHKNFASSLADALEALESLGKSRELSLVKTKLEEAVMWFESFVAKAEAATPAADTTETASAEANAPATPSAENTDGNGSVDSTPSTEGQNPAPQA